MHLWTVEIAGGVLGESLLIIAKCNHTHLEGVCLFRTAGIFPSEARRCQACVDVLKSSVLCSLRPLIYLSVGGIMSKLRNGF